MPLATSLRVIIADDQQTSRLLLRTALNELGLVNITMAKDGEEALTFMMREPAHLLISDDNMPRMGGLELLRAVRANVPTRKSAFFLLLSGDYGPLLKQAAQLQVTNYLKKPVSTAELKLKIEAVFGPVQ